MLSALTVDQVLAISAASAAKARDAQAMETYLHGEGCPGEFRVFSMADLGRDAEAGAFASPEQHSVRELIAGLSPAACRELVALIFFGRGDTIDFPTALAQARRTSDAGNASYAAGKPLQDFIPAALDKLGLTRE